MGGHACREEVGGNGLYLACRNRGVQRLKRRPRPIDLVNDGVHQITGADLTTLGMATSSISPRTLKIYENGQEIPLWYIGDPGSLLPDSKILFVGQRNRGTDEDWAYRNNPEWQSSTYFSLSP